MNNTTTTNTSIAAAAVPVNSARQPFLISIGVDAKLATVENLSFIGSTFLALVIQIVLYRPLYKFASLEDRYALFIVFYKACTATSLSLQSILGSLMVTNPPLNSFYAWICLSMSTKLGAKLLVLLFTFCRFYAVIFPLHYEKVWKRRIHLYAVTTLIVASIIGSSAAIDNVEKKYGIFIKAYTLIGFTSIHLGLLLYAIVVIKLAVWRNPSLEIAAENDRIKLTIVCMASLLPMFIDVLPYYNLYIVKIFSLTSISLLNYSSTFQLVNQALMNGFDEYTLLLINAKFRRMVISDWTFLGNFLTCKIHNRVAAPVNSAWT